MIEPLFKEFTGIENLEEASATRRGWLSVNINTGEILDKDGISNELLGNIKNLGEIISNKNFMLKCQNNTTSSLNIELNKDGKKRHLCITFNSSSINNSNVGIVWVKDETDKIQFIKEIEKLREI